MSFWDYYSAAIPRAFCKGWDWAMGQGIRLTILLTVLGILCAVCRVVFLRRRQPSARSNPLETLIDGILPLVIIPISLIFLFIVFFALDAPEQLSQANTKISELQETIKVLKVNMKEFLTYDYKNERLYIMPPQDGGPYNDWIVRMGFTTKETLRRPKIYLIYAEKLDDPKWGVPIQVKAQLAWYAFDHSYDLETIESHEYAVLFRASKNGKRLYILTNGQAYELNPLKDIRPGKYKMTILIGFDNNNIPPKRYDLFITWTGSMDGFHMDIKDVQ